MGWQRFPGQAFEIELDDARRAQTEQMTSPELDVLWIALKKTRRWPSR